VIVATITFHFLFTRDDTIRYDTMSQPDGAGGAPPSAPYSHHTTAAAVDVSFCEAVDTLMDERADDDKLRQGAFERLAAERARLLALDEKKKTREIRPDQARANWTKEEHRQFLLGLEKYGKGDWRSISRNCVVTRTPSQVASHAQKYYLRLSATTRKRGSINDNSLLHWMAPEQAMQAMYGAMGGAPHPPMTAAAAAPTPTSGGAPDGIAKNVTLRELLYGTTTEAQKKPERPQPALSDLNLALMDRIKKLRERNTGLPRSGASAAVARVPTVDAASGQFSHASFSPHGAAANQQMAAVAAAAAATGWNPMMRGNYLWPINNMAASTGNTDAQTRLDSSIRAQDREPAVRTTHVQSCTCARCGKISVGSKASGSLKTSLYGSNIRVCMGCADGGAEAPARYCSLECQCLDWPRHKRECAGRAAAVNKRRRHEQLQLQQQQQQPWEQQQQQQPWACGVPKKTTKRPRGRPTKAAAAEIAAEKAAKAAAAATPY